jgi:hypothetical protein
VVPSVAKRNNIINMVLRKREAAAYDYRGGSKVRTSFKNSVRFGTPLTYIVEFKNSVSLVSQSQRA